MSLSSSVICMRMRGRFHSVVSIRPYSSSSLPRRRQRNAASLLPSTDEPRHVHHLVSYREPSNGSILMAHSRDFAHATIDRRWASSIVRDEMEMEHNDGVSDQTIEVEDGALELKDIGFSDNATSTKPGKKKKLSKRQKRKQSTAGDKMHQLHQTDVKFMHFQGSDGEDEATTLQKLRDDFDNLAFNHDLSKFKWISMLEKTLVLKVRQEQQNDNSATNSKQHSRQSVESSSNRVRDYWKIALKGASNKRVPADLKEHFLNRMIVQSPSSLQSVSSDCTDMDQDYEDAKLLERGRELAVDHPLLWRRYSAKERKQKVRIAKQLSKEPNGGETNNSTSLDVYLRSIRIPALRRIHYETKNAEQKRDEARALQQLLKAKLPDSSYGKMIALVQTYVDCFSTSSTEENQTDEIMVNLESSPLTRMATPALEDAANENEMKPASETEKTKKKQQQKQFRVLLSNLRKALPQGRIHWIGKDVADFFYVTTPDEVDLTVAARKIQTDGSIIPNHRTFEKDNVTKDPVLGYSQQNWEEVREQYVQSFWNIRKLFLELEKEQEDQDATMAASVAENIDTILDPNDDPSSEKSVLKTFDVVTALSRLDTKKTTTQRVRPRTYIPLEAMAMGDYWTKFSSEPKDISTDEVLLDLVQSQEKQDNGVADEQLAEEGTVNGQYNSQKIEAQSKSYKVFDSHIFPLNPPTDRLVVVDNLPIDMTDERLYEAYGRCGEIEAIQIFHSRPDLDPGRRATDDKKKIRSPSSSSQRQKWSRPRTPLYAMLLYKDSTSAKKASCDPLRIFGMVLDHHLMRSHRASDMTMLYLEDVPSSIHDVSSMEFELSQLLRPADLYLCLDDSGHNRLRKKERKTNPSLSYAIQFPTFEAAYWAYWKLSLELQFLRDETKSSPALHWMETPRDAELYWTRKLNF